MGRRQGENRTGTAELPRAGEILIYDYRPAAIRALDAASHTATIRPGMCDDQDYGPIIKCLQWNIERGYRLDQVIAALQGHHADIICLQELDIGCERSAGRDCAREIAQALRMKCAFYVEFEEQHSPLRSAATQGGGVHGNAILSRWDLEPRVVEHSHHPVDWHKEGIRLREPRRGRRAILAADVHVPGLDQPVLCYSLHLEVFCGIFGRVRQMADAFADSRCHLASRPWQLIFGDLNTMAHGIARLSRAYCRDGMRMGSLGYSEAAWWHRHLLTDPLSDDPPPNASGGDRINSNLLPFIPRYLSRQEAAQLRNPHFYDPFSLSKDTTLQSYRGLYRGKLDWTLLRGWHVLAKGMDNHHYRWSDHKLLYVLLKPVSREHDGKPIDPGVVAFGENHVPLDSRHRQRQLLWGVTSTGLLLALLVLILSTFMPRAVAEV